MNSRTFPTGGKEMFTGIETIARGEDGEIDGERRKEGVRRYAVSRCLCWIKNVILEKTEVLIALENILYLY